MPSFGFLLLNRKRRVFYCLKREKTELNSSGPSEVPMPRAGKFGGQRCHEWQPRRALSDATLSTRKNGNSICMPDIIASSLSRLRSESLLESGR